MDHTTRSRRVRSSSARSAKATTGAPISDPSSSSGPSRRNSARPRPATFTRAIVVLVAVLALCTQYFAPRFTGTVREFFTQTQHWRVSKPSISLRSPLVFDPETCPNSDQHAEFKGTFNTRPERSMALAEQAKRVAAEFDFGPDAVNKAVKEFVREMGMYSLCSLMTVLTS